MISACLHFFGFQREGPLPRPAATSPLPPARGHLPLPPAPAAFAMAKADSGFCDFLGWAATAVEDFDRMDQERSWVISELGKKLEAEGLLDKKAKCAKVDKSSNADEGERWRAKAEKEEEGDNGWWGGSYGWSSGWAWTGSSGSGGDWKSRDGDWDDVGNNGDVYVLKAKPKYQAKPLKEKKEEEEEEEKEEKEEEQEEKPMTKEKKKDQEEMTYYKKASKDAELRDLVHELRSRDFQSVPMAALPDEVLRVAIRMCAFPDRVDWNSEAVIAIEKLMVFQCGRGKKMRDRGPPGPAEGGPDKWQHQKWRDASQRWGNRGGQAPRVLQQAVWEEAVSCRQASPSALRAPPALPRPARDSDSAPPLSWTRPALTPSQ